MDTNSKLFSLIFLFFAPFVCNASSLIQDSIIRISATTDRGDVISIEADSDQLKNLSIEINEKRICVNVGRYSGLKGPYLHSMKLYVDSAIDDGEFVRRIVIPFFEYKDSRDVALVLDIGPRGVLKAIVTRGDDFDRPIDRLSQGEQRSECKNQGGTPG